DELQRHDAVVDVAKFDSAELEHVDLDPPGGEIIEQRFHELLRDVAKEKRAIAKIHADDAEGFLLGRGFFVEHADVHHDLAGLIVDATLKLDSHPAMAFGRAAIAPRHDRVCEREKRSALTAIDAEPLHVEIKFAVEHCLKPATRHVA